jgi:hypothetical protein
MIAQRIPFGNRTFYAKFERIDEPLTPLLLKQHHQKEYTIALPLLQDNHTNYLVIEYKGQRAKHFCLLAQHLMHSLKQTNYHLYQGKDEERVQLFISVERLHLTQAHAQVQEISRLLAQKMPIQWRCLPSLELPEAYNIVTLPYQPI